MDFHALIGAMLVTLPHASGVKSTTSQLSHKLTRPKDRSLKNDENKKSKQKSNFTLHLTSFDFLEYKKVTKAEILLVLFSAGVHTKELLFVPTKI